MDDYRVGDAERDQALEQLREHFAAGRLDQQEFQERSDAALRARFASDLGALFTDLPTDHTGAPVVVPGLPAHLPPSDEVQRYAGQSAQLPATNKQRTTLQRLALGLNGSLFPLVMIIQFATGFAHWWLWLLPMAVAPLLLSLAGEDDK